MKFLPDSARMLWQKKLPQVLLLITGTALNTACDSSATDMVSVDFSAPRVLRTTQAVQYNKVYAEVSVNNGAIQRSRLTSTTDVLVTGIRLDQSNDITVVWFETFQNEPLELARQNGSFIADSTVRTANIDFPYDYSADDDGDGTNNITERRNGTCPVTSGCDSVGFNGSYTIVATSITATNINGESCGNGAGTLNMNGTTVGGNLFTSSGVRFDLTGTITSAGVVTGGFARDGLNTATFNGSFSGTRGSGIWQDVYQCSGSWVAVKNA